MAWTNQEETLKEIYEHFRELRDKLDTIIELLSGNESKKKERK